MIRYALKCADGHAFESWFQNADAYEALARSGHVSCPDCGKTEVAKLLMAPGLTTSRSLAPTNDAERKLADLRAKVEAESDYVGMSFAAEARAIHEGDAPKRSIYGEARAEDAIALLEDGVPVAPLPFLPTRKTN